MRNLIIFSVIAMGSGWLGVSLDSQIANEDAQGTLGVGLWLVLPLLTMIILRTFGGDRWKDAGLKPNFKSSWFWYIVAILIVPTTVGITLGLGVLVGAVTLTGGGIAAFIPLMVAAFVGNLLKNIFEEFSWRGYLTPRLQALGIRPLLNHVITGIVWAGWHIPFWIYFLSRTELQAYTSLSLPLFIIVGSITLVIVAVAFGELRLISRSVWPVYIMHTIGNAIMLTLILEGFIGISGGWQIIFNPTMDSLLMVILFAVVGVVIYRIRKKTLVLTAVQ